jgi:hypothetical protein
VLAVSLAAVVWPGSKATAATEFPTQNATWRTCGQWPLQVSEDGRFFVQRDGTAFFPIIDTVWMLSYLNQADVDQYLARRPANGFNAVYVSLLGVEKLPDGLNSPNYAGHRPFAGDTGAPDTSHPQAAFFEDFKATLRKLRDHDLTVFLVVGWSAAWQPEFTRPGYRRYVEFVLDRYPVEEFPNIVWCLGGDRGMFMQKNLDKPMQIEAGRHLRRLMEARGDRRLIGDHPGRGSTAINYTPEEAAGWLDFYTVQSGHRGPTQDVVDWVRQVYERRPVKPVFNGEPLYEAHNPGLENAEVRWAHWVSVFSGACAVSYGCQGFWGIGVEVAGRPRRRGHGRDWWKEHLDDQPVANQMQHFAALNRAYPFHLAIPDYAAPRPLVQDRGQGPGYRAALLAADRRWALIYLPSGRQAGRIVVSMDLFRDPLCARWLDPTSGAFTPPGVPLPNTGTREFEPPARNQAQQWDWVLVLGPEPDPGESKGAL